AHRLFARHRQTSHRQSPALLGAALRRPVHRGTMSPRLPQIRPSMLREHGSTERVNRIWRKLEPALERGPSSFRPSLVWAPAVLSFVFGAGVFVGAKWTTPASEPALTAEPARMSEPA